MHRVNVDSMERFQGAKVSRSYHQRRRSIGSRSILPIAAQNPKRRVHITLNSAESQTSRCNASAVPTEATRPFSGIHPVSTGTGRRKAFSSTIARDWQAWPSNKRRRGAAKCDWQRYNFETRRKIRALLMYKRIVAGESVRGLKDPKQTLRDIGLLVVRDGAEKSAKKTNTTFHVPHRILVPRRRKNKTRSSTISPTC